MKARLLLVAMALALALVSGCAQSESSVGVVRVIDGDTIVISGGATVRYIGIDTPERGEPYYQEALEANRRLVEGKSLRLERDVSEEDRYGRLLRYVYQDGVFVNVELVRMGWAEAKAYPPDTRYQWQLEAAEEEARVAERGIWAGR
ncbi:MAG: thermonuclease family protein [Chloroflexota bacterium]